MKDHSLLTGIQNSLQSYGIDLLIAEHKIDLLNSISDKIKAMITECHLGLVLLTKHGFNSGFVREEIGFLEAKGKPSLLIIEKGLEKEYSGFKFGHEFIVLNPDRPSIAEEKIKSALVDYWKKMCEMNRQIEIQKAERERQQALIGLGIVAGIIILGSLSE